MTTLLRQLHQAPWSGSGTKLRRKTDFKLALIFTSLKGKKKSSIYIQKAESQFSLFGTLFGDCRLVSASVGGEESPPVPVAPVCLRGHAALFRFERNTSPPSTKASRRAERRSEPVILFPASSYPRSNLEAAANGHYAERPTPLNKL